MPDVSIIGTGALGSALARALTRQDIQIKSLYNRKVESSQRLGEDLEVNTVGKFPQKIEGLAPLTFLTVPDGSIRSVADELAVLQNDWTDFIIVHCSGTEPAAILSTLADKGAHIASFHPMQTFTNLSGPSDFKGISFDMEGDSEALSVLKSIAERLGALTFKVTPKAKRYLHASAVIASNYLVALLHASEQVASLGDLDTEAVRNALLPLMRQSLENTGKGDLPDALSGPIARGDVETVSRHLQLLKPNSNLLSLYKQLGRQALHLASRKKTLTSQQITKLEKLLTC